MEEAKNLLIQLIQLAEADEELREKEYEFLLKCARMLGISQQELDVLFAEHVEFEPPSLEPDRIIQFYRLILLANVDLKVSNSEYYFLKEAGVKLGLNPDAIEIVIFEMLKYPNGVVPTARLIEIFQVYHN